MASCALLEESSTRSALQSSPAGAGAGCSGFTLAVSSVLDGTRGRAPPTRRPAMPAMRASAMVRCVDIEALPSGVGGSDQVVKRIQIRDGGLYEIWRTRLKRRRIRARSG